MRSFSEFLFDIGFFPLVHESVKTDFISWYYNASKSEVIRNGLDVDNSQLIELGINAHTEAERFDDVNPVVELIELFEEWKAQIEIYFYYTALFAMIFGGGITAVGILQLKDSIFSFTVEIIGGFFLMSSVSVLVFYKVITHQLKENTKLVARFNEELSAKPGEIRESEQDWNMLAAKFFWNKSLLSPRTHAALILLSIIKVVSSRIYGFISADIRNDIQDFVGMSSGEIIRTQLDKLTDEDYSLGTGL
jgi:hypothetical protein